ncbi:hypothetical protein BDV95DRAFT_630449 [Massariosphaeria phaeospora]|uniref:BTB domain-containing protein n=1 Tax=Massariosphaeria phaeospora TaxID=100035 RepID=A0A7C8M623_9PLEO|nr:hypothetical protein BDV95DRAFT_630449 [Massariosphaeria phaeospora]
MADAGSDAKQAVKKVKPLVDVPKCPHASEPPSPDNYGPIITVVVGTGDTQRKFYTYHGLLTDYSSYFRAALKEVWEEGATRTLYTYKLHTSLASDGRIPLSYSLLCQIYVFGDARGVLELCNTVINVLFQKMGQERVFVTSVLHYVYTNTLPGSKLRKFLVDEAIARYGWTSYRDVPYDFLMETVIQTRKLECVPGNRFRASEWATFGASHICDYHDHSDKQATS